MISPAPRPASDAVTRYFAARAASYATEAGRGLWAWQKGREARALFRLTGPLAGRAVLDLGSGAGFYAKRALAGGASEVTAVDRSPEMLAAIDDPAIRRLAGDAHCVALDRQFDRVILAGLLEFAADPAALIANAARHCATGGRILVLYPPANLAGRLYRRFHRRHGFTVKLFAPADLARLAAGAGLRTTGTAAAWPLARLSRLEP